MKLYHTPSSQAWLAYGRDGAALSIWTAASTTPVSVRAPAGGYVRLRHRRVTGATAWRDDAVHEWRPREGGGA